MGEAHHALSDTSSLPDSAFTQPEDVLAAYTALSRISRFFTIAVAFGNVHGRYREGNVKLQLSLLDKHQKLVASRAIPPSIFAKPVFLVFHGGSGTKESEFREAIAFGTIKVNINADTQFAYMSGIRQFMLEYKDVSTSSHCSVRFLRQGTL